MAALPSTGNEKRDRFCDEYLVDLNGTQAAIRAGYSARTAGAYATKLLKVPEVQQRITAGRDRLLEAVEVTQERVITELARLAFSRIDQVASFDESGVVFKRSDAIPADALAAVESVKSVRMKDGRVRIELKLHSKEGALKMLGQYLELFGGEAEGGHTTYNFVVHAPPPATQEDWMERYGPEALKRFAQQAVGSGNGSGNGNGNGAHP